MFLFLKSVFYISLLLTVVLFISIKIFLFIREKRLLMLFDHSGNLSTLKKIILEEKNDNKKTIYKQIYFFFNCSLWCLIISTIFFFIVLLIE